MRWKIFERPDFVGLLAGILCFLVASGVVWLADRHALTAAKSVAFAEVSNRASDVQLTIGRALSATYALAAMVRQGGGQIEEFDAIAAQLMPFYPGASSLQMAPNGVIRQVYPLKGNEKVVGYNLLADPAQIYGASLARDSGQLTLVGPFNLIQGGIGAAGRLPIFIGGTKGQPVEFWGFATTLIRFPEVLQDVRLDRLPQLGYQYRLWRVHPDTRTVQVIASSLPESAELQDPLDYQLTMPNGKWMLSVAPTKGWRDMEKTAINVLLASLISILLGWLAKQMVELRTHRESLALQVAERTRELIDEVAEHRATSVQLRKLSLAVEQSPTSIIIADLEGNIEYVNQAFLENTGYTRDEVIGKNPRILQSGNTPPDRYRALWAELAQGRVWKGEFFNQRKDGRKFTEWATIAPIRQSDGKITHYVAVKEDITEKMSMAAELEAHRLHLEELVQQRTKDLIETEARATHILQSSADGLYGVDQHGVITFINRAACAMLGYRAEQAIGQIAHNLFHHSRLDGSPYLLDDCPSQRAIALGKALRSDKEVYWHADGHSIPVMFAIHPIVQNEASAGAVVSFVDISEQRAAMAAREQALLAAEHLAKVRSEFLANMSHEIRTPLNGVLGFAEIGYRNYQNSEKARNAFAKIQMSGNRLLGVINDILDFSKIEAGKLHIELASVNIPEVIQHAVELVHNAAVAKHLDLRVELSPNLPSSCISDSLRMGQVLLNVLSNAVKFTERGSVVLSVSQQSEMLVFSVLDTGIGVSESQRVLLFNPFQQADASTTRRFGGTGLGLAICKRILEMMNGDISLQSEPGKGSHVIFRLPCIKPEVGGAMKTGLGKAAVLSDKPLAGITFLVAEDEVINQLVLEEHLIADGARVVMVSNGREAVERVAKDGCQAFDIVLMDIQMPEMDGYEAARQILEMAPDMPIIAQTAHAFGEERDRCLAAGMVGHLAKPIDPDVLRKLVLSYLLGKSIQGYGL